MAPSAASASRRQFPQLRGISDQFRTGYLDELAI